jgi:hypothetical protein
VDNLNTHVIASLYVAFLAQKVRVLAKRLEIHYTPKHGSWLNVFEVSISVLSVQCVGWRIFDLGVLNREICVGEMQCSAECRVVNWQFRADDARLKLKRLYPAF